MGVDALSRRATRDAAPIRVENPIAAHLDVMRTTLAGGLIDVLRTNLARKQERIRIFEAGRVYLRAERGLRPAACALAGSPTGPRCPSNGASSPRPSTSSTSRATSKRWSRRESLTTERAEHPLLHPGRAARVLVDGSDVGWLGELHPRIVKEFELPRAPILFELRLDALTSGDLPAAQARCRACRSSGATWPSSSTTTSRRRRFWRRWTAAKPAHVDSIRLFDVYRGQGIAPGKKSLAILVLMQDTERTLTDAEIDATMADLLQVLAVRFAATLRQ